jgi:hypothetical protein
VTRPGERALSAETMEAGTSMDARVAIALSWRNVKLWGAGYVDREDGLGGIAPGERYVDDVPPYSTDIRHAWSVVEAMKRDGWHVTVADSDQHGRWYARFWRLPEGPEHPGRMCAHVADAAPLAIVLAALSALEPQADPRREP